MTIIRILAILALFLSSDGASLKGDFGRGRLIDLAGKQEVRRELGVADPQGKRLDEVIQRLRRVDAAHAEARSEIAKMLEPKQLERLDQIRLQALGGLALQDPAVVEKLDLSPDQRRRIDDARETNKAEERDMEDLMKRARFPSAKARNAVKEKFRTKAGNRLLAVLTDVQKAKLEAIKGEAYSGLDDLP